MSSDAVKKKKTVKEGDEGGDKKSKSPKKEKAMSTAEWNNPTRITNLMAGTPVDPDKLTQILPEFKLTGKKCSLMVPKTKFAY